MRARRPSEYTLGVRIVRKIPDANTRLCRKAVLEAYRALHTMAKVEHQSTSMAMHSFHVLYNEHLKRAFIVDFEYADFKHLCGLQMPLKAYESMPSLDAFGCEELLGAMLSLGMIA